MSTDKHAPCASQAEAAEVGHEKEVSQYVAPQVQVFDFDAVVNFGLSIGPDTFSRQSSG